MKEKKLSLIEAIPYGIGSIMGSGVLFLPSATYNIAKNDVLIAWVAMILLCIPGIFFFKEMVSNVTPGDGMAGIVELGLGKFVGDSVYVLLFGTVILGMPSAAIIASEYLKESLGLHQVTVPIICYFLLILGVGVNMGGIKVGSVATGLLSGGLLILSILLIGKTFDSSLVLSNLKPTFNFSQFYPGMILSFWAFAGFENLTFLSHKFKNPQGDLIRTILISLVFCGLIYLGLVMSYGIVAKDISMGSRLGLLELAVISKNEGLRETIGGFAIGAVLINLISWSAGVSRIIEGAVKKKVIPIPYELNNRQSLLVLGISFLVSSSLILSSTLKIDIVLKVVSVNFLLIYCLAFGSYLVFTKSLVKRIIAFVCITTLLLAMLSTGYLLCYPLGLMLVSTLWSIKNETRILDDLS